ncbi:unnamed protein product [Symbiodinium sp. KB8]|nr:unnamed protein product [Symbiodinium sp. KB8]
MELLIISVSCLLLPVARACESGSCGDLLQVGLSLHSEAQRAADEHPWPHARGKVPGQRGTTDVQSRLPGGKRANWSWHNPAGRWEDMVGGGPVIDKERCMYLMTEHGLWKFSPSGNVLWHYRTPGKSANEPYLTGDMLLSSTTEGNVFAVDRHTGQELWVTHVADDAGADAAYPAALGGVFVVASSRWKGSSDSAPSEPWGNTQIFGLAVHSGEKLWDFESDAVLMDFTPLFPNDDTFVFMSQDGSVYRVGLHNGTLLWKADSNISDSYSDGGAVIGPNGVVYACSNIEHGMQGTPGVVRAFTLTSGHLLWEQILKDPCCTFPAVGHVKGSEALAVVVAAGAWPKEEVDTGSVLALEAETGALLWQFNAEPYAPPLAAGDEERLAYFHRHPGVSERLLCVLCLPAQWSAPVIAGDGAVYVGRADGKLYVVHGALIGDEVPANLTRDPVTGVHALVQSVGSTPVHGALGFAEGLLAYATCDSLYVWQEP